MRHRAPGLRRYPGSVADYRACAIWRYYVAPAIAAFRERYPHVNFELQLSDHVVDLYSEDIDMAIRWGRLTDSRLVARRLATSRRILVASAQYLRRHGSPEHPKELAGHPCLLFAYPGVRQNRWSLLKRASRGDLLRWRSRALSAVTTVKRCAPGALPV
ncbi:substrate binding domain-containing protein [Achromobacter xylosoxidans]